jgi:hypothetical protein
MTEEKTEETQPEQLPEQLPEPLPEPLPAHIKLACDIATGKAQASTDDEPFRVIGATKDYNARGSCRGHWFRMVLRGGQWEYVTEERLPNGNFLASDRKATVRGDVFIGEITITHDRGKPVDLCARLVTRTPEGKLDWDGPAELDVTRTRDGNLKIKLPDGSLVVAPDPRKK